jgi:four helix bundle protein
MANKVMNHRDLDVYRKAFDAAMQVFKLSKCFPKDEQYALTDQIRRSSHSVCANLAEAWRRRRYEAAFIDKLSVAESEVAETQVWLEFAVACDYLKPEDTRELYRTYNGILNTLVGMITHTDTWIISRNNLRESESPYELTGTEGSDPWSA